MSAQTTIPMVIATMPGPAGSLYTKPDIPSDVSMRELLKECGLPLYYGSVLLFDGNPFVYDDIDLTLEDYRSKYQADGANRHILVEVTGCKCTPRDPKIREMVEAFRV